jgi:hypothetical protein
MNTPTILTEDQLDNLEIRVQSSPSTDHPVLSTYWGDGKDAHVLFVDVDVDIAVRYNQLDDIEESLTAIQAIIDGARCK